jgi:beta-lactamase class A
MNAQDRASVTALQQEVEEQIHATDAEFGVWIRHLPSGATVAVNPDALYLLASVFKIPIMLEALAQVDEGRCRLDERIELRAEHQLPTSMILEHLQPGLALTLRDLLTAMITVSDNTATDMVLDRVGVANVGRRLAAWGLHNIAIHTGVKGLFDAAFATSDAGETIVTVYRSITARGPLVDPFTGTIDERYASLVRRGSDWEALPAQRSLANNVASPRAVGELLERLVRGELLSRESTGVALDILLRQQLNQRLPRYLPPTVRMGHKTGTFYSSKNDAGILYLPDGGHVVIAAFAIMRRERLDGDPLETVPYSEGIDRAMGRIARSALDIFSPEVL